jgi:arylsulfatase A-like enzyme
MNVLFIMADQLRWDHLSCAGHPHLHTPNIDALAARGVRFSQAYVTSGVCGPSRMSYYTGRYPISHGATWNRVPLPLGEVTLGEMIRAHAQGRGDAAPDLWLAGKTHVMPDLEGLKRLSIEGQSELGHLLSVGGFHEVDRHDGHHETGDADGYGAWLRTQGYDSPNPWSDYVISAIDEGGQVVSGWHMRNVHLPARVQERHSETAYMTDQAIAFMRRQGSRPWVLHLSYVKPHWPYMAPAPYHAMYRYEHCLPTVKRTSELDNAHPVLAAYRQHEESATFARDEVVGHVRPAYQGLIKQLDDHLGRLFNEMAGMGRLDDTLVIFCADHGDFLGDHWLGEKEQFFDTVQRVPFIVADPRREADATRGRVDDRFVECVDVVPTILETLGVSVPSHRVEGRSLLPLLHGQAPAWRDFVYSELDYGFKGARLALGRTPQQSRAFSIRTATHRYVNWLDLPEQLWDLRADPDQFDDLGREASTEGERQHLRERLLDFLARRKHRTTLSDEAVERSTASHKKAGVFYGQW